MKSKRLHFLLFYSFIFSSLVIPNFLYAYERYGLGETATIGEFVYDDDFVATTTAGCTLSIFDPDENLVFSGAMTASTTGWTYHDYNIPEAGPAGLWPTEMACGSVVGGDLVKLDKSFVVGTTTSNVNDTILNASSSITSQVNDNTDAQALDVINTINANTDLQILNASSSIVSQVLSSIAGVPSAVWTYISDSSRLAVNVWGGATRTLTSALLGEGGSLATNSYIDSATSTLTTTVNNASSSLAGLIGSINLDTSGLATGADITNLTNQLTAASSSLAVTIPSALTSSFGTVNTNITNASSSLFALLSGIMSGETNTITNTITNASSSLAVNIVNSQNALNSTLDISIENASSSLYAMISSFVEGRTDVLSSEIANASSSLGFSLASIVPPDTSSLTTQINNASSSLASLFTSVGNLLGTKIDNASSSLSGQVVLEGSLGNWNVTMSNVDRTVIGTLYRAKIYVTDSKSVPTNSLVAPKISLYNEAGDPVTEDITMTNPSTGVYTYSFTIPGTAEGLWEAEVRTEVEVGKIITTNDYFAIEGSPAQVRINDVTDKKIPEISANVTITNEGSADYEYHYEWCVVSDINNACGGGDDIFYASNSKLIEVGQDYDTDLTATVPSTGNYYFKLMVYYGTEKSGASRYFTAESSTIVNPPSGGGGGGGNPPPVVPVVSSCQGADFNHDKKVNSVDFSILLAFWKTVWPFKNPCVDINQDKKVNSVDFSILMYEWGKKIL